MVVIKNYHPRCYQFHPVEEDGLVVDGGGDDLSLVRHVYERCGEPITPNLGYQYVYHPLHHHGTILAT